MRAMTPRVRALLERAAAALGTADGARCLREIDPSDVGLPERLQGLRRGGDWQEVNVCTTPSFRASLFLMPAGGTMPIHDHPGMNGLLTVLWGRVRIRSYDWAEGRPGLARVTSDGILGPADGPQPLGPRKDNLHRLDAVEESAFLDLLTPDYSEEDGRPCAYYAEDEVALDGDTCVRLRPMPPPQE
jgi:hypothetical protein